MARTQPVLGHFTSRQSVLRRSFERSHRFCLVAAHLERIAAADVARHSQQPDRNRQAADPQRLAAITDPSSYAASQRCGDAMRERRIQAFEVPSARSAEPAPVVGVLTANAFSNTPFDLQDWSLEINADGVIGISFAGGLAAQFTREHFLVAGRWPGP
jgi:hypothetical protein